MLADARVLDLDFLPDEELLVHRDAELNTLANTLAPVTEGRPAPTVHIYGPSGSGKTAVARLAVEKLRKAAIVRTGYVNCWQDHARYQALFRVCEELASAIDLHRQNTPEHVLRDRLRAIDEQCVVICDEADQLEDPGLLYDLAELQHVTIVLIANREEALFHDLPERLVSRLHAGRRLAFEPYSHTALVDILNERIWHGLQGTVTDRAVDTIAEEADGDARRAIATLKAAVEIARDRGTTTIDPELVESARPRALKELRRRSISSLTPDQRVLYEELQSAGEAGLPPGELYERYTDAVEDPKSRKTVTNYLQKLERYELVKAEGQGPRRTYRAVV